MDLPFDGLRALRDRIPTLGGRDAPPDRTARSERDRETGRRDAFSDRIPDDRVFDVVADLGADDAGERPIDHVFEDLLDEGSVGLWFPDGEYAIEGVATAADDVELRGAERATLNPTRREEYSALFEMEGDNAVIDGFEIRMDDCGFAPRIDLFADDWRLSRVVFRGAAGVREYPDAMDAATNGVSVLRLAVTDSDGVGTLRRVYMPDGAATDDERRAGVRDNRRAAFVMANSRATNRGRIEVEECWFENWAENTWYGEYGAGTQHITDVYVRNSPIGLRISGGSTLERVTVVKDGPVVMQRESLYGGSDEPGSNYCRGVMLRWGNSDHSPQPEAEITVRNCDFHMVDDSEREFLPYATGGALAWPVVASPIGGRLSIEDTRITMEHPTRAAIQVDEGGPTDATLRLADAHVSAATASKPAVNLERDLDVEVEGDTRVAAPGGAIGGGREADVRDDPEPADPTPPLPAPPADGRRPR